MGLKECLVLVLASGCALAANYTIDDCPASIPHDRHLQVFGDTCYSFMTSHRREFDAAERECESNLGHLVIIRDAATQDFLYNALRHDLRYNGVVWIGLSDKVNEGQFVWVDGSPAHYTHWASGQPGILGGLDDCVGMNIQQQGQWNDYQCEGFLFISNSHVFVCEYPLGQPSTFALSPSTVVTSTSQTQTTAASDLPTTTLAPSSTTEITTTIPTQTKVSTTHQTSNECPNNISHSQLLRYFGNSCYSFHISNKREFVEAERECEANGGHLVSISDIATQSFVYNTLRDELRYSGVVWIGLSDRAVEGHFQWIDGSPVRYVHWASGHPSPLGGAEDCVGMNANRQGLWEDRQCQAFGQTPANNAFVCEYPAVQPAH
ncbi:hypothetical protein V1264_007610 [Littorina saxatilis]|uniref:C-type lectin domain-containing protein n=1 Tax=Littorina saxatilis TaxID=31220 RepID=A0AAN9AV56_9CAEN